MHEHECFISKFWENKNMNLVSVEWNNRIPFHPNESFEELLCFLYSFLVSLSPVWTMRERERMHEMEFIKVVWMREALAWVLLTFICPNRLLCNLDHLKQI
jgi:hypothetical protein